MSPICTPSALPPVIEETRTAGVSGDSDDLSGIIYGIRQHFMLPLSRSKLLGLWDELDRLGEQCREPNWDGYGAKPIGQRALVEAKILVRSLPSSIVAPEIVPEPSGAIGFEWRQDNQQTLILSVFGEGEIQYAAILAGGTRKYGAERFSGEIPDFLATILVGHFTQA